MRPVSAQFRTSQPFGSMRTAGVVANSNPSSGTGYYVYLYGNYQPFGHAGMDIACPEGTPVYAIASGTVLWADWGTNLPGDESNAGYRRRWYLYKKFPGIVTVIQHQGWVGVYAHLSRAQLNVGDRVTEGQQIGLSGGTGGVAPHLHVEALVDLNYPTSGGLIYGRTDPEPFFGSAAIAPQSAPTVQEDTLSAAEVKQIIDATQAMHDVTRAHLKETLPKLILDRPVPYKDPITGKDTGETTTLATMAGFADFQATQTRLNTNAASVAASIPDAIAQEVIDALAARLGGAK